MTQASAIRRRQQARMGYKHMSPQTRPGYKKVDSVKSARRMATMIANQQRMKQGSKGKT